MTTPRLTRQVTLASSVSVTHRFTIDRQHNATMTDDEYDPDCNSREEYWERINIMADAIEDHYEPGDELPELVFEEVDQSRFAMMHHEAIQALRFSGEGPHEWKHFVSDDDSWRQVICAMAFDAVRNDLWAEIHDRGIDQ